MNEEDFETRFETRFETGMQRLRDVILQLKAELAICRALSIAHDLDSDCSCHVCLKVAEIARSDGD